MYALVPSSFVPAVFRYHGPLHQCEAIWGREKSKFIGRGDRIRTCDIYVPNVALYQSELHPDDRNRTPKTRTRS